MDISCRGAKMRIGLFVTMNTAKTFSLLLAILVAGAASAWSQVAISTSLETIRVSHHLPGLSAMVFKQGRIMAQGATGYRRQGGSHSAFDHRFHQHRFLHEVDDGDHCREVRGSRSDPVEHSCARPVRQLSEFQSGFP